MSEKLNAAVEALLEELEQQARAISETKKMINSLRRRMGEEPLFLDEAAESVGGAAGIKPGSYYGKPLATAMVDALRRRGSAATTEEILADLRRGEFNFKALGWQESGLVRALAMSMAKNTKAFHRLPSGSFGLLEWYPEVLKNAGKEPKAAGMAKARKRTPLAKPTKRKSAGSHAKSPSASAITHDRGAEGGAS